MASANRSDGGHGCVVVAVALALVVGIAKCGSKAPTASEQATEATGSAQQALSSAVAEQRPARPKPLSRSQARRGASRVATASVEGLGGEMIYSQNCYDAVGHDFSWSKLDECGGFDAEAATTLGDEEPLGAEAATAWFANEAAAERYLKAATSAGLDPEAADQRLADLIAAVSARHRPRTPSPPVLETMKIDESAPSSTATPETDVMSTEPP